MIFMHQFIKEHLQGKFKLFADRHFILSLMGHSAWCHVQLNWVSSSSTWPVIWTTVLVMVYMLRSRIGLLTEVCLLLRQCGL